MVFTNCSLSSTDANRLASSPRFFKCEAIVEGFDDIEENVGIEEMEEK
jgi:hypothetical protein